MTTFTATHQITIQRSGGQTEKIPVAGTCAADSGRLVDGPCYTEAEWDAEVPADWEYDEVQGLVFHGREAPHTDCTVEIHAIGVEIGPTPEQVAAYEAERWPAPDGMDADALNAAVRADIQRRAK